MKMFGVIILSIMTGGIYAIVYSIKQRRKRKAAVYFAEAVRDQALAYDAYDKNISADDKKIVNEMLDANSKYARAWNDIVE